MRQTAQEELKLVIQQINELTKIYHNAVSSHHISENEFWIWYILILTARRPGRIWTLRPLSRRKPRRNTQRKP